MFQTTNQICLYNPHDNDRFKMLPQYPQFASNIGHRVQGQCSHVLGALGRSCREKSAICTVVSGSIGCIKLALDIT